MDGMWVDSVPTTRSMHGTALRPVPHRKRAANRLTNQTRLAESDPPDYTATILETRIESNSTCLRGGLSLSRRLLSCFSKE